MTQKHAAITATISTSTSPPRAATVARVVRLVEAAGVGTVVIVKIHNVVVLISILSLAEWIEIVRSRSSTKSLSYLIAFCLFVWGQLAPGYSGFNKLQLPAKDNSLRLV